eukprot:3258626-Rhodomonas_salina.2
MTLLQPVPRQQNSTTSSTLSYQPSARSQPAPSFPVFATPSSDLPSLNSAVPCSALTTPRRVQGFRQ